jgi:hypothetical protein
MGTLITIPAPSGLLSTFPGTNNPVVYPDLNSLYGNPDIPSSPLYGGGSSGQSVLSQFPSVSPSASSYAVPLPVTSGMGSSTDAAFLNSLTQASLPTSATTSATSATANPCPWYDLVCQFTPAGQTAVPTTLGSLGSSISGAASSIGGMAIPGLSGFTWGRVGTFLLALILIAAGLYLFGSQSAQGAVTRTVKRGLAI